MTSWASSNTYDTTERVTVVTVPNQKTLRLHVLSDLHTDRPSNLIWLKKHFRPRADRFDVLVCAGDISNISKTFEATLAVLVDTHAAVIFIAGNHDCWTRSGIGDKPCRDSFEKIQEIKARCAARGVHTGPCRFVVEGGRDVVVVPLWSWYDDAFDVEEELCETNVPPGLRSAQSRARWIDYTLSRWGPLETLEGYRFSAREGTSHHAAKHFARVNEVRIAATLDNLAVTAGERPLVVTMSHFCPRHELLPEKRFLVDPHLPKVAGTTEIERQLRQLRSDVHVFGHTHLAWDLTLDSVRYINWPLGSPREMQNQTRVVAGSGALVLYDAMRGLAPTQWTFWGDWYRSHQRNPMETTLAPWIRQVHKKVFNFEAPQPAKEPPYPHFPDGRSPGSWYRQNSRASREWRSVPDGDDAR